jgi:hypothetical protein
MVEVLGILGFLGWLFLVFCEWLSHLPVFAALVVGAIAVPILAVADFRKNLRKLQLPGLYANREPIPPERFSWLLRRGWLHRSIGWSFVMAVGGWYNAATLPASLAFDAGSVVGWINAIVGIAGSARFFSTSVLFLHAAQWFDSMSPSLIGFLRLLMYRLSDNYEYLGQRKTDPEREKVY